MKKNISSKTIKAMAIGLSIAMGAGTGVSGVMVNTHTVMAAFGNSTVALDISDAKKIIITADSGNEFGGSTGSATAEIKIKYDGKETETTITDATVGYDSKKINLTLKKSMSKKDIITEIKLINAGSLTYGPNSSSGSGTALEAGSILYTGTTAIGSNGLNSVQITAITPTYSSSANTITFTTEGNKQLTAITETTITDSTGSDTLASFGFSIKDSKKNEVSVAKIKVADNG